MRFVRRPIEALIQTTAGGWLGFEDPARVVCADGAGSVRSALADVERLTRDLGFHAVGFVTYEAAEAFDLAVRPVAGDLPLVWFALFEPAQVRPVAAPVASGSYELERLVPSFDRASFTAAFERIKTHLAAGDTYQVNLTFTIGGQFAGDPRALFADLVSAQQGAHSAYLSSGDWSICSASPELFFEIEGTAIRARPMKGTTSRGRTGIEDAMRRDSLFASEKQRAENVMVVDMVRNDLGRIAEVGSVTVPELFTVERYPGVWQMTSSVTGRTLAPLEDVFAALHPSASVTGAPKVRTMQIVRALEPAPRGVYTGAIGHIRPDGDARFNVAIRTAVVDNRTGRIVFGTGSGIVWDSDPAAEYDECLLKSAILGRRAAAYELLETMRWSPGEGFFLLERHLARLRSSADYFGFPLDMHAVMSALIIAVRDASEVRRVRLLLSKDGEVRAEEGAIGPGPTPMRVTMAAGPVDSQDVFLFHKTTNRAVYEAARVEGFDETILWNGDRQVTEATTANLVVEIDGRRLTPPAGCGLLAGTYRAELLDRGELEEAVIPVGELRRAERLWLINSVHEWRLAALSS
ncbi:MAG: aminodeoxychorismate synthase component I [Luteitalea sp.]|nr:aminodeoxychorismate synthase component I [Luteitalea sp.]